MRAELDRLLALEPGLLWARYARANLLLYYFPNDFSTAEDDLTYLLSHRHSLAPEHHRLAILAELRYSWLLLQKGKIIPALENAERGLTDAAYDHELQEEAHYALARANAVAARCEPLAPPGRGRSSQSLFPDRELRHHHRPVPTGRCL